MRLDDHLHAGILGIIAQRPDSMRSVINVLITVATGSTVHADGVTTELFGAVDPALVLIHRALAGGFVTCVELVPGVHEDQYVFHALTGGALDEFTNIFFVGMLAAEWAVPIFDMRDSKLFLGQPGIIHMSQLAAANPAVEGVFLNADLETVRVILVLGQQGGREAQGGQGHGGLTNKRTTGKSLHGLMMPPRLEKKSFLGQGMNQ